MHCVFCFPLDAQEELKQHASIVLYWQCHMQLTTLIHSAKVALAKSVQIDWLGHLHFQNVTRAWTDMVKPTTLLTVVLIALESWSSIMLRGVTFLPHGWDVRPITTHWVNWPIRAQWAFRKKELCRNPCVLERLLLRSLFSAVIQKPMEKSDWDWVIVKETRVMLTSGLTSKMMSSRQHSIVCCFAFLSLMQSIIG